MRPTRKKRKTRTRTTARRTKRKNPRMKTRNNPRRFRLGTAFATLLLVTTCAWAGSPDEATRLLQKADSIKSSNRAEFVGILNSLSSRSARLSGSQKEYLSYLQGWNAALEGENDVALRT